MNYKTEAEQVQDIKRFIRLYFKPFFLILLLMVVAHYAWDYWQQLQVKKHQNASALYESMVSAYDSHPKKFLSIADELQQQDTVYGDFAALFLAKYYVSKHQFKEAEKALRLVIKHGRSIQEVAKPRLNRLVIEQKS